MTFDAYPENDDCSVTEKLIMSRQISQFYLCFLSVLEVMVPGVTSSPKEESPP